MTGYQAVAESVYAAITSIPNIVSNLGFGCASQSMTNECRDQIINSFGLKAFRRPLMSDEITRLQNQIFTLGTSGIESVGWVLCTFVLSSRFLLRNDVGHSAAAESEFNLTAHEVASRIS